MLARIYTTCGMWIVCVWSGNAEETAIITVGGILPEDNFELSSGVPAPLCV